MRKFQIVACLSVFAVLSLASFAQAALPTNGARGDANISLVYDPADGHFWLDAAGKKVTTLEIQSASGVFTGAKPAQVSPPFDVFTPKKFFILKTAGVGDEDFGMALPAGLTAETLGGDLTVAGSILPSGSLGTVDLVYLGAIPEPSSLALMALGFLGLVSGRRKRA